MSVDSFTQVVGAVSDLLGTILWPMVAVIVVTRLLPDIRKMLNRGGFNFKAPGVELSVEKASEAAAALGAAAKSKGADTASPSQVAAAISGASRSRLSGMRPYHILWVDDHPENNEYESQAMSALGFRVDIARSTKEAMRRIRADSYDLVISDLGRQSADEDDPEAGITLLKELRQGGFSVPYIVYAGRRAITERDYLLAAGATFATNSPTELVRAVADARARSASAS